MKTDERETGQAAREPYTQPLLTRHEPLRALTGKSGEKSTDKDPFADKDPNEKAPKTDNPTEGPG